MTVQAGLTWSKTPKTYFLASWLIFQLKSLIYQMSRLMGKPTICIGENKGADQLRGNREADQRLCFRYSDSTIPPLLNSKISSFQPASVLVQPSLCQSCSETTLLVFPRGGSNVTCHSKYTVTRICFLCEN